MSDTSSLRTGLSVGALAFGVSGVLAPQQVAATYGASDTTPEHRYTIRIWAAAVGALGVIGLLPEGLDDRRYFQVGLALNSLDTVIALTSGGSARLRFLSAATSGAFAAAAAYGLRKG
jgi:hypothetical protein